MVPISVLHHSPLYWKNPEEFDPERLHILCCMNEVTVKLKWDMHRFTAEEKAKRPHMCHMPFGFGPRGCIGLKLGLLEIKIAFIKLLQRYTFIRAPETEVFYIV